MATVGGSTQPLKLTGAGLAAATGAVKKAINSTTEDPNNPEGTNNEQSRVVNGTNAGATTSSQSVFAGNAAVVSGTRNLRGASAGAPSGVASRGGVGVPVERGQSVGSGTTNHVPEALGNSIVDPGLGGTTIPTGVNAYGQPTTSSTGGSSLANALGQSGQANSGLGFGMNPAAFASMLGPTMGGGNSFGLGANPQSGMQSPQGGGPSAPQQTPTPPAQGGTGKPPVQSPPVETQAVATQTPVPTQENPAVTEFKNLLPEDDQEKSKVLEALKGRTDEGLKNPPEYMRDYNASQEGTNKNPIDTAIVKALVAYNKADDAGKKAILEFLNPPGKPVTPGPVRTV